ncbi:MAG: hypothetical protein BGO12_22455 [Verrucomicrobia bacterium 61-8]|nr:MAG: hypothetical protein BGO12_22455 [Verrucomicrobia bacterium 61-8]
MKHPHAILAALALGVAGLTAQDATPGPQPAMETFMQRSEKSQATLLDNSNEILRRIGGIEKTLVKTGAAPATAVAPDVSALESRLKELEAKLAAAPPAPETATAAKDESTQTSVNAVWIVLTAALVFFMQAGFCMLELGFTRAKNAINICMKNFLDFCVGTLCFLFLGFGLMFGHSVAGLFGTGPFWISDVPSNEMLWSFWFFQLVFCGTAATIISGAMAERTKFVGYLIFTALITGVLYPVIGHWAWGSFGEAFGYGGGKGWLEQLGYLDFAGSSVVHSIGGAAALAGVLVVGPRIGRFKPDGTANLVSGHNMPLATLGVFILWLGWYGFNPGSTLLGDANIGRIAVNTTIAPAAGAIAGMFAMWLHQGRPDLGMTINGALGGLVGITANCNIVSPASAVVIGLVAGVIATFGSLLLERLRIDDAVGAVPVHLFCGWWGILSVAIFNQAGFSPHQLGIQTLGVASITAAAFGASFVGFFLIDKIVGLRASEDEQDLGLDFTEHSGAAYPDFITGEQGLS